jgi:hypothetical protein
VHKKKGCRDIEILCSQKPVLLTVTVDWEQTIDSTGHRYTVLLHYTGISEKRERKKKEKWFKQSCSICTEQNVGNFNLVAKQFAIGGPMVLKLGRFGQ